jgi:hypothetical protein
MAYCEVVVQKRRVLSRLIGPKYGWNERHEKGVSSLGTFVLKKGQTTDNGKLQVKLVDVIPGDSCAEAGTTISRARATLQFVRLPEQKVLCEDSSLRPAI